MERRWFLCSHSSRTECRILATIDVVMSSFMLILLGLLVYGLFWYPHLLEQYVEEDSENRQDLAKLLAYGPMKQILFLAIPILRAGVSFILGIILFIGAQRRKYGYVRVWILISVIYIVIDLILFIPRTIYTQQEKLYVIISLANFVYIAYELWIVFALKDHLRAIQIAERVAADAEDPVTEDTVVGDGPDTPSRKY